MAGRSRARVGTSCSIRPAFRRFGWLAGFPAFGRRDIGLRGRLRLRRRRHRGVARGGNRLGPLATVRHGRGFPREDRAGTDARTAVLRATVTRHRSALIIRVSAHPTAGRDSQARGHDAGKERARHGPHLLLRVRPVFAAGQKTSCKPGARTAEFPGTRKPI